MKERIPYPVLCALVGVSISWIPMTPLGIFSLGTPGCGWPCMSANVSTGAAIGLIVAGVARVVTGKESWR